MQANASVYWGQMVPVSRPPLPCWRVCFLPLLEMPCSPATVSAAEEASAEFGTLDSCELQMTDMTDTQ